MCLSVVGLKPREWKKVEEDAADGPIKWMAQLPAGRMTFVICLRRVRCVMGIFRSCLQILVEE